MFLGVSHAPLLRGVPKIYLDPMYLRLHGLTYSDKNVYDNTLAGACFKGVSNAPAPMFPEFLRPPACTHSMRDNSQILRGDLTTCEEKFFKVVHKC